MADLHERQWFDFLLAEAGERFADRIVQHAGGADAALAALTTDPQVPPVRLDDFVSALFADFLLDNSAGACFVLQSLERRALPVTEGGPVGEMLQRMARRAFADLLAGRTAEVVSRSLTLGGRP